MLWCLFKAPDVFIARFLDRVAVDPVRWALGVGTLAFLGGGSLFALFEEGADLVDGLYWATVVMPTVGFGDFSPESIPGRFLYVYVVASGWFSTLVLGGAVAGRIAARKMKTPHSLTPEIHDDLQVVMGRMAENTQDLERLLPLVQDPRVVEALREVHAERGIT